MEKRSDGTRLTHKGVNKLTSIKKMNKQSNKKIQVKPLSKEAIDLQKEAMASTFDTLYTEFIKGNISVMFVDNNTDKQYELSLDWEAPSSDEEEMSDYIPDTQISISDQEQRDLIAKEHKKKKLLKKFQKKEK